MFDKVPGYLFFSQIINRELYLKKKIHVFWNQVGSKMVKGMFTLSFWIQAKV